MIELKEEKVFKVSRIFRLSQSKNQVMFDKSKSVKYTCSCSSTQFNNNRIEIYLGLTNGSIMAITIYKQA